MHPTPPLLDEMFRMRARVFGERLGWDVTITDGQERDAYDALDPSYIIIAPHGRVQASVRLLPTTGRTMLAEHFPEVPITPSPLTWEATRFCVERHDLVLPLGGAMTAFGLACGITSFVGCFDAAAWRIYRAACAEVGTRLEILGTVKRRGTIYIGRFEVSDKAVRVTGVEPRDEPQAAERAHHCGTGCCPTRGYGIRKAWRGW
jgi:acyl homoserine lactone synthase